MLSFCELGHKDQEQQEQNSKNTYGKLEAKRPGYKAEATRQDGK
jgi:hypothetical protein